MSAPVLTNAQRQQGAAKSLETRRARAELKDIIYWHPEDFEAWLSRPEAQGMKVRTLLLALPHVGPKRADALLAKAGIDPARTVARIGPKQKQRLLELLR